MEHSVNRSVDMLPVCAAASPGRLSEWYFNCHHHGAAAAQTGSMSTDRFTLCSMPGLQPVIAAQY